MKAASNIAIAADALAPAGAQALAVSGVRAGQTFNTDDWVADEVPVALEYNGISHAVMLATPLDLEDFALGFSLSEGILESTAELRGFEQTESPLGITLHLEVSSAAFMRLKTRRRSLAGRTGCGLCGVESLEQAARLLPPLLPSQRGQVARAAVARAMRELPSWQVLQQATGAVHAAGWCSAAGELLTVREDVGRHNALDKLIGAMAIEKRTVPSGGTNDGHHGRGTIGGVPRLVTPHEHSSSGGGVGTDGACRPNGRAGWPDPRWLRPWRILERVQPSGTSCTLMGGPLPRQRLSEQQKRKLHPCRPPHLTRLTTISSPWQTRSATSFASRATMPRRWKVLPVT